jgi:mannose/fructose/N-acetylgalactosamine-specific phosphotransferase system component IIC
MVYKNVDRKLPAKGLAKLGWAILIAGLWIATYWAAFRLGFHPGLFSLVPGLPVYFPGEVIYWGMNWASDYPQIFAPALLLCAVSFFVFIALVRKSRGD